MEHATQAVGEALELVMGRYAGEHFGGFLPIWVPTLHNRRIVAAIARVDAIQEATAAAIDAALGGRLPTLADLPELVAVERVVKEAMRIYPPAWSIGREAIDTVEVGPHRLPRGAQIAVFPWALHRDPRYFREPEAFIPGRWEEESGARPKFAYMPFGAGPRICIGNTFAMTEAILVVTRFLQRFTVTAVDRQPPRLLYSITLRPRDGIRLELHLRS